MHRDQGNTLSLSRHSGRGVPGMLDSLGSKTHIKGQCVPLGKASHSEAMAYCPCHCHVPSSVSGEDGAAQRSMPAGLAARGDQLNKPQCTQKLECSDTRQ